MTKTLVATPDPPSGPCGCWADPKTPPTMRQPLEVESQGHLIKICQHCGQAWEASHPPAG